MIKASHLVRRLHELIQQHGDRPVLFPDYHFKVTEADDVVAHDNDRGIAWGFLICDQHVLEKTKARQR